LYKVLTVIDMFIREDLIFAQFKLKGEINCLHSQMAIGKPGEETMYLRQRLVSLEEKLKQVKHISNY
jgi:hypothetical protein